MTVLAAEAGAGEAAAGSSTAASSGARAGSGAPRAPMGRRTSYEGPGRRQTERGSTVETHGGGSRVTINPGRERGPAGSRGAPGRAGAEGTGGHAGPPGGGGRAGPAGAGGSSGRPGARGKSRAAPPKAQPKPGQRKQPRRYNSASRRSTGISPLGNRDYQAIIAVEFVLAELLVAATPFATRKDRQGLSPYAPADMVKLLALGLVYLILMMIAALSQGAGRVCAYIGGLVLLTVGMGEAANLVDIIEALVGGKPHTVTLTGTQAPAVKDPAPIPPLGQDQPKPKKGAGAPLGGG
jgi:hypothetical protein